MQITTKEQKRISYSSVVNDTDCFRFNNYLFIIVLISKIRTHNFCIINYNYYMLLRMVLLSKLIK